jgi:hypothetical protein
MSDMKWYSVQESMPGHLETVWISNGKGWTDLGCWHMEYGWALSNGVIYEVEGYGIVAECEGDDLDVQFWHPVPKPIRFGKDSIKTGGQP